MRALLRPVHAGCCALLVVLTGVGCSKTPEGYYPAKGRVVYKGEPAVGAVVFFQAQGDAKAGEAPTATVDDNGDFEVESSLGPGIAPGKYSVLLTWPVDKSPDNPTPPPANASAKAPAGKRKKPAKTARDRRSNKLDPLADDRLKGRYFDAKKPAFTAEIKPEANDVGVLEIKD